MELAECEGVRGGEGVMEGEGGGAIGGGGGERTGGGSRVVLIGGSSEGEVASGKVASVDGVEYLEDVSPVVGLSPYCPYT